MSLTLSALLLAGALLFSMLGLLEAGRRFGRRRIARDPEGAKTILGPTEGAVFGLLGLMTAFTFSGAGGRFDARRAQVVSEANAIGTAWQRVELLPAPEQPALRDLFRTYLDARLDAWRRFPDVEAAMAGFAKAATLQGALFSATMAACQRDARPQAAMLLLPPINEMGDLATKRMAATRIHPPLIIFTLLFGLGLGCSFLAGYGMAGGTTRNWIAMIGFAAVLAVTFYVIIDLEYPRLGLIRIDAIDDLLIQVRAGMG